MTSTAEPNRLAALRGSPILLLALFTLLLVTSAGIRDAGAEGDVATPRAVTLFLVRHAEKGTDDPKDPTLTAEGLERSKALDRLLSKAGVTHLYSSDYRRTRQTLAPLVERLGVKVESYDARAIPALAERLKGLEPGAIVVVAGHSNTTPDLYTALGGGVALDLLGRQSGAMAPIAGGVIPDADYDRLYQLTLLRDEKGNVACVSSLELRFGEE